MNDYMIRAIARANEKQEEMRTLLDEMKGETDG